MMTVPAISRAIESGDEPVRATIDAYSVPCEPATSARTGPGLAAVDHGDRNRQRGIAAGGDLDGAGGSLSPRRGGGADGEGGAIRGLSPRELRRLAMSRTTDHATRASPS